MKPFYRDVLTCLTVAALVGGAAWAYEWYSNRPRFAIENTQFTLEALLTGQEQEVTYRIHNMTGNIMRIVGAEAG